MLSSDHTWSSKALRDNLCLLKGKLCHLSFERQLTIFLVFPMFWDGVFWIPCQDHSVKLYSSCFFHLRISPRTTTRQGKALITFGSLFFHSTFRGSASPVSCTFKIHPVPLVLPISTTPSRSDPSPSLTWALRVRCLLSLLLLLPHRIYVILEE